ncbi:tripartite tricarboxylate transporter permease [Geomicrobium sp. JCM 19038]|uniref:tripartite tricarboxylate transporter permease n=1 Tax=Geomicrobium sp. JCM 19038 TaxID=1460635 RepID=UPI00045F12E3|nr:tripartite tricarboxylate transporter permease [Geomicrobium sp. JCM 19038]GAK07085.1 tricarboxylate transport membrane protein TctA [Geomicrobium sp. JCM 19038]
MESIFFAVDFLTQLEVFLLIATGAFLGLLFGAIPGLTATLGIVLLMPVTFGMEPAVALAMLSAIYVGGVSGGFVTAILLNIPGTSSSIATTLDGHPMAKNGQPGKALSYAIISSFVGGFISYVVLMFIAPMLGGVVLSFQSFEYVLLGILSLFIVAGLAGKSYAKGLMAVLFGLLITSIGPDPNTGQERFTFGMSTLQSGVELLPALVGLYVVSQLYSQITKVDEKYVFNTNKMDSMRIPFKEIIGRWKVFLRSTVLGIVIGILPGAGGTVANFLSYDLAKKTSKNPEKFGTGTPDGVIASETTNNAVSGGAYVPTLALGIPGNTVTAILLAGLLLHGVNPGPTMFTEERETVISIFAALMLANIIMIILMYTVMIRFFTWALRVPKEILLPLIAVMAVAGTYNLRFNFDDLIILLIFSFIGYLLLKADFPLAPIIMGIILGPVIETNLNTSLMASSGSFMPFLTRPVSLVLVLLIVFFIIFTFIYARINKKKEAELAALQQKSKENSSAM